MVNDMRIISWTKVILENTLGYWICFELTVFRYLIKPYSTVSTGIKGTAGRKSTLLKCFGLDNQMCL